MEKPINSEKAIVTISPNLLQEIASFVLDTHSHAHLERLEEDQDYTTSSFADKTGVALVTCAVAVDDWDLCLNYAAQSTAIVPAIGVHPWYCEQLLDDSKWLDRLEELIQEHPGCIVGEIGLCKIARWVRNHGDGRTVAMDGQRRIFVQQLQLAGKYQRPVSVHCVQQHGVLLQILQEQVADPQQRLPPSIALHSFTGTAHHVKKLLQLEQQQHCQTKFYFGFSHTVNYAMCTSEKSRRQTKEAILAVPPDRLLVESDVHRTDAVLNGTIQALAYVAQVLGGDEGSFALAKVARDTHANGLEFLRRGSSRRMTDPSKDDS